ncbi:OmpA family protein [Mariniflexile sp.]|uniref:OmpA family protein n=2 Tax=Mariniflexile sp. TaxID=1979402 RepID=UPI004047ADB1
MSQEDLNSITAIIVDAKQRQLATQNSLKENRIEYVYNNKIDNTNQIDNLKSEIAYLRNQLNKSSSFKSNPLATNNNSVPDIEVEDLQNEIDTLEMYISEQNKKNSSKIILEDTVDNKQNYNYEIDDLKREIAYLKNQFNRVNTVKYYPSAVTTNNSALNNEVEDLHYEIDKLRNLVREQNDNTPKIIVTPLAENRYRANEASKNVRANNEDKAYSQQLRFKLDSIYTLLNKSSNLELPKENYNDNLASIENKLNALQQEINLKKTGSSINTALLKKYSDYKMQLYFQNNSKTIDPVQSKNLLGLVNILKENDKIDVLVKGFASKKGNPIYNQNLSMQRTEAIKLGLIKKGIHPTRILTVYHGVDYEATTDEEARRADISLIIRK